MEFEEWEGGSMGPGPIVISADWDGVNTAEREQFLCASAGPTHRPVRVPYSAFDRFLNDHRGAMFLCRDVPAVVAQLTGILRDRGKPHTEQWVWASVSAGSWVDVFQLLHQVVGQQARWPEKLDEAALRGVHELLGDEKTGGLEKLIVIAKGCLELYARFERAGVRREDGHRLLAELFDDLRSLATPLLDEANTAAVECSPLRPVEPLDSADDEDRPAMHVKPLPGTDDLVAAGAWELLGNRIDVWAGIASQNLERAELVPDPQQIKSLRRSVSDYLVRSWGDAEWHRGLRECFQPPDGNHGRSPVPVHNSLRTWLAGQAESLHDDDYIIPDLTPAGDPPSLEPRGFWAAASPALATCRELLRCHAVSVLVERCANAPLSGFRSGELDVYRRMARASGHTLFSPPRGHEFWVVRPQSLGLHSLAAILDMRGHYAGVFGRLHYLLADGYQLAPGLSGVTLLAAELEARWQSAPGTSPAPTGTEQASTLGRTRAFLERVRLEDPCAIDWVRTARALIDTATFRVPTSYLRCIFDTDYRLNWSETAIRRLRSIISAQVLPELGGYWEDQRITVAARRLGLPDEEAYARLQDQTRCVAELGSASQSQLRASLGAQLMKDVAADGGGRVVSLFERLRAEHGLRRTATTAQLLRALLLTRGITAGGRVVGPGYWSGVCHDEWIMTCEEVRLGAVQELLADGLNVLAATPEEILLQVPAGRADPVAIRESAERGGQRVLGQFGCRYEAEQVQTW